VLHLHDLALDEVLDRRRHELDGLEAAQPCEVDRRPREQEIARENGKLVAKDLVHRRHATPRVGLVDHVVVQQTCRVDHLAASGHHQCS
jgi:hypothetical protein